MWTTGEEEDPMNDTTVDDEEGTGIGKKELVDGLIAAVGCSESYDISANNQRKPPGSPRGSNRHRLTLEEPFDMNGSRSPASSRASSSSPSSGEPRRGKPDADETPRAIPRTRSKVRARVDGNARSVKRNNAGRTFRDQLFRGRSKSMGGVEKEDRRARFGDEVKSPGNGLLK
jgi:hypothetical protein